MAATYTKPTKTPRWADDLLNNLEPSEAKKDLGWVFEEAPASNYENYRAQLVGQWFKWIGERFDDGASKNELYLREPSAGTVAIKIAVADTTFNIAGAQEALLNASGLQITNGLVVGFSATPTDDAVLVADANFGLAFSTNGVLRFDSTDSLTYNRASNYFDFAIGSTTEMKLDASGLQITNGLVVGFAATPTDDAVLVADANFGLAFSTNGVLRFDSTDSLTYNRASNYFDFAIGSTTEMKLDASGLQITNGLVVGFAATPGDDQIQLGDAEFMLSYSGGGTVPELIFASSGGASYDTLRFNRAANTFEMVIANSVAASLTSALFTTNSLVTGGYAGTIVAGAGGWDALVGDDDFMIAGHKTAVAHGLVAVMGTTDTWFLLEVTQDANGGAILRGANESVRGVSLVGHQATSDSATSTAALGAVMIQGTGISAGNESSIANGDNILAVWNATVARLIVKGNGDLYIDGTSNTYDDHQDAVACHDAMYAIAGEPQRIIAYDKKKLSEMGVMSEGGFINVQNCMGLLLGGVGEMYKVLSLLLERSGMDYESLRQEVRGALTV